MHVAHKTADAKRDRQWDPGRGKCKKVHSRYCNESMKEVRDESAKGAPRHEIRSPAVTSFPRAECAMPRDGQAIMTP